MWGTIYHTVRCVDTDERPNKRLLRPRSRRVYTSTKASGRSHLNEWEGQTMTTAVDTAVIPWWKEPTKDQWIAWWAAWLGWTLDAFHFTVFLLIMVPISQEFGVPLVAVTAVFTITLWLRLVGATASGWLADRVGRKLPLMLSILCFSLGNVIAGFSPSFEFLSFFRALLGIGMGAEWPAGAWLGSVTSRAVCGSARCLD